MTRKTSARTRPSGASECVIVAFAGVCARVAHVPPSTAPPHGAGVLLVNARVYMCVCVLWCVCAHHSVMVCVYELMRARAGTSL
jgi:hypothetical protein